MRNHFVGFVMRRLIYRCSRTTSTTYVFGLQLHYKHFVETKDNVLRFLEHLLYFFFFFFFFVVVVVVFFIIKTTVQEFEQNQYHDIIRSSEMNMLFSK